MCRWGLLGVLLLALAAPASVLAAVGRSGHDASLAVSGDRAATRALIEADYRLEKALLARDAAMEGAVARTARALGHECKGVLRGAPDESVFEEEGPFASTPKLSGRAQGERARSEKEKQTIEAEIDETLADASSRAADGALDAYIASVDQLDWSDPTITALVQQRAARIREDFAGPQVAVCAEMRSWAAGGFHLLPPGSKHFEEARQARDKQAVEGDLGSLLRPYEGPAQRTFIRRIAALTAQLREKERSDEVDSNAEYQLELALGEKVSRFAKQNHAPPIAKGRTRAGTTFLIRASPSRKSSGSCRHEVDVEVREGNGRSISGVCLDERGRPHPSGSCSGSLETIQLATPPEVRQARVRFSNGRTITVSVVQIPAKDGGPAGLFIDAFRGYKPYPVSLQELSSNGSVLRTVGLRGGRCVKEPAGEPEGPEFVHLATVAAPSGEALSIEGMLHTFRGQTEFSLAPQWSIRNSEAPSEHGQQKQFQWEISTECPPHAYSLLSGILQPPGASVLVRTPAGLTPLTRVELFPSTHAEGPLFYGVYTTLPTEIVVQRSNGTTLYSESLAAKATEETEFCEGYAEQ